MADVVADITALAQQTLTQMQGDPPVATQVPIRLVTFTLSGITTSPNTFTLPVYDTGTWDAYEIGKRYVISTVPV